jgi:hypothetical protein
MVPTDMLNYSPPPPRHCQHQNQFQDEHELEDDDDDEDCEEDCDNAGTHDPQSSSSSSSDSDLDSSKQVKKDEISKNVRPRPFKQYVTVDMKRQLWLPLVMENKLAKRNHHSKDDHVNTNQVSGVSDAASAFDTSRRRHHHHHHKQQQQQQKYILRPQMICLHHHHHHHPDKNETFLDVFQRLKAMCSDTSLMEDTHFTPPYLESEEEDTKKSVHPSTPIRPMSMQVRIHLARSAATADTSFLVLSSAASSANVMETLRREVHYHHIRFLLVPQQDHAQAHPQDADQSKHVLSPPQEARMARNCTSIRQVLFQHATLWACIVSYQPGQCGHLRPLAQVLSQWQQQQQQQQWQVPCHYHHHHHHHGIIPNLPRLTLFWRRQRHRLLVFVRLHFDPVFQPWFATHGVAALPALLTSLPALADLVVMSMLLNERKRKWGRNPETHAHKVATTADSALATASADTSQPMMTGKLLHTLWQLIQTRQSRKTAAEYHYPSLSRFLILEYATACGNHAILAQCLRHHDHGLKHPTTNLDLENRTNDVNHGDDDHFHSHLDDSTCPAWTFMMLLEIAARKNHLNTFRFLVSQVMMTIQQKMPTTARFMGHNDIRAFDIAPLWSYLAHHGHRACLDVLWNEICRMYTIYCHVCIF